MLFPRSIATTPPELRFGHIQATESRRVDNEGVTMALKASYSTKELAELIDIGETTLQNQVIPVIKRILAETLDQTLSTIVTQSERIEFLEEENRQLYERLEALEEKVFSPSERERIRRKAEAEPAMLDLEAVLGIELDAEPALADGPVFTVEIKKRGPGTRRQIFDQIRRWRNEGFTFRQIADRLNSNRTPTLSGKGLWDARKVQRFFSRP